MFAQHFVILISQSSVNIYCLNIFIMVEIPKEKKYILNHGLCGLILFNKHFNEFH